MHFFLGALRVKHYFENGLYKRTSYVHIVLRLFTMETITRERDRERGNSYTMGCPPVRGDNPRALASGLSYVQVDKHGITILNHLHQCRPCTSRDISC